MTRLEQAALRLERAVARLEAAASQRPSLAGGGVRPPQIVAELEKARAEAAALKTGARDIAERLDAAIGRVRTLVRS